LCVARAHSLVVLLMVALVCVLTPAAYADPPDPTWLAGYWDDDDFDNVVVFISGVCAIAVTSSADAGPVWVPAVRVEPAEPVGRSLLLDPSAGPRSPPISFSSYS
jgi:hypothetical protein